MSEMTPAKLWAIFDVFRKGKAVANPVLWKTGQITVSALVPVVAACVELARVFGYNIPLSDGQNAAISGGIIAIVNIVCTIVSTEKIGVGKATPMPPSSVDNLESAGSGNVGDSSQEPTRASLGYERVGSSPADRAGG